jgi:hypothetical protein
MEKRPGSLRQAANEWMSFGAERRLFVWHQAAIPPPPITPTPHSTTFHRFFPPTCFFPLNLAGTSSGRKLPLWSLNNYTPSPTSSSPYPYIQNCATPLSAASLVLGTSPPAQSRRPTNDNTPNSAELSNIRKKTLSQHQHQHQPPRAAAKATGATRLSSRTTNPSCSPSPTTRHAYGMLIQRMLACQPWQQEGEA